MAAPMANVLHSSLKRCLSLLTLQTSQRNMGFISNLRRKVRGNPENLDSQVIRIEEELEEIEEEEVRKKRKCIEEVKPFQPPSNVEQKIQQNVDLIFGPTENWRDIQLNNRLQKYELLTSLIDEFDHDIPSVELNEISNMDDIINYYTTEVRDTSAYTEMAKLDLPKNLHINLEPSRFNADNDPLNRKTAFPELKTIVTSVKYRRKYQEPDDDTDPIRERPVGIARWKN